MARRGKIFIPNHTYFITFTILGFKKIFTSDETCNLVYKWFDYSRERYGNRIYGYVIMPNHVHLLMYITDRAPNASILIMNAKRFIAYGLVKILKKNDCHELLQFFAQGARKEDRAKHKLFTDRYDSLLIESLKFFIEKLNYIHANPCAERWQLVQSPEDYTHSSAANYTNGTGRYPVTVEEL